MSTPSPLPSPPFHPIPNLQNLRSATHSLRTSTGISLRQGLLFRSADLSKLSADGIQALAALGVRFVFDLRSRGEVEGGFAALEEDAAQATWEANMAEAGIQRQWTPVFQEQDYSPERLAARWVKYMDEDVKGFVGAYEEVIRDAGTAYARILRCVCGLDTVLGREGNEEEEGEGKRNGVLVHCTAGKDRTGMFFGILFDFLGVEREEIAREYNLTERGLESVRESVVQRLMGTEGFRRYVAEKKKGNDVQVGSIAVGKSEKVEGGGNSEEVEGDDEGRKAALRMVGARKETMLASLKMIDEVFGGSEKYLREWCGLSGEELERLRRVLLLEDGKE